jgi:hypothetical protein
MRRIRHSLHAPAALAAFGAGLVLAVAGPATPAGAAPGAQAVASAPVLPPGFRDPGVPPELRADAPAAGRQRALAAMRATPRTSGAELQAQVDRQLHDSFDAADVRHRGAITRDEARAGGFGFVALHFDEIDVRRAGEVRFEDLQRFLRERASSAHNEPAGATPGR